MNNKKGSAWKGSKQYENHSVGTGGEDNESFKSKPNKNPIRPTNMAKVKEKPGSLLRYLLLFSMSCLSRKEMDLD